MKTRILSLLTALMIALISVAPACAIVLDGYNRNNEYDINKPYNLFDDAVESGNNTYWAQAFVKTEDTLCYIIFNVLCNEPAKNTSAGVIIKADDETLKADMTQEEYAEYDRKKFDFSYAAEPKTGGFTVEVRINFKNGLEDGEKIKVQVMDTSGEPSAVREMTIRKTEATTTEKTTKPTTEKTTKEKTTKPTTEKTTKPTTEKTTKEKTTKPSTTKASAEKAKTTAAPKTRREITHRAVTTTVKKTKTASSKTARPAKTEKETVTKFRAQPYKSEAAVTQRQSRTERETAARTGTVTYSYITEEYTTSREQGDGSSKNKKKIAAFASATLVIAACVLGTMSSKKDESDKK